MFKSVLLERVVKTLALTLAIFTTINCNPAAAVDVKKSVVQIFNESVTHDYGYPWQIGYMSSGSGSGVIIDGKRILTAAHVVNNSLSLLVRKVGSEKRYPATLKYISDERDLAIIEVDDKSFFDGTQALSLGALPDLGDVVTTWGFPLGGDQLAITRGIISRIDYDRYSHAGFANLVAQTDAAINPGASGGPALIDGMIAGISFQGLRNADNVGYIVPSTVVQQFFDDIKDGKVDGVPEIAIAYQPMKNPQLRRHYGMKNDQTGVLVIEVSGLEKDDGFFKVGDILLQIDGQKVGNDGTVSFFKSDRVNMDYLLVSRQIGETVSMQLLRDKKIINIDYPIRYARYQAVKVPHHKSGYKPPYLVVGGIVFQELTFDYLNYHYGRGNFDEYHGWMKEEVFRYKEKGLDQKERTVVASQMLPDEINRGYELSDYNRVKSVNGVEISNIEDMRQLIESNESDKVNILFEHNVEVVFETAELEKRDTVIAEKYGID